MQLKFLYPHWGSEHLDFEAFLNVVQTKGFDGIEINIPKHSQFNKALNKVRKENPDFICVLQQVLGIQTETPATYFQRAMTRLEELIPFEPDFINSHTGRDYFTFDENCKVIEAIENFSARTNIPVFHEIHRGRFTFHSLTTLKYLEKFPNLKLVGDLSHWCVVSESMLQNQNEIIQKVIPHIHHVHARVGFEQSPQVNHPFALEWTSNLNRFMAWWKAILNYHKDKNEYTITPEFGPYPYMPQQPFNKEPLADQHAINAEMKDYLKTELS